MAIRPLQASNSSSYLRDMPCEVLPWNPISHIITNCFGEIAFVNQLEMTSRSFAVLAEETTSHSVEKAKALGSRIGCANVHPVAQESHSTKSLEARFRSQCLRPVDIHAQIQFADFLSPNEYCVMKIKPHLDMAYKIGDPSKYHFSTGTERSLFGFLLASNCKGLIIRDINPRVKAYSDFNILLLRVLKDSKEFLELSTGDENEQVILQKKAKIWERLEADREMPLEVKSYYQHHFNDFASIYFGETTYINWRNREPWDRELKFQGVDYYNNETLFQKLKSFAKSGNIIATIGDIGDLAEFKDLPIGAIDISNIPNYTVLDFNWPHDVRIIWTKFQGFDTQYFSKKLTPISTDERRVCADLLESLRDSEDILIGGRHFELPWWLQCKSPPFFCKELLVAMQKYRDENCLHSSTMGWMSKRTLMGKKLQRASVADIRALSVHPEIQKLSGAFARGWVVDKNVPRYMAMAGAPGWMEEFRAEVIQNASNPYFLEWLTSNVRILRAKITDFPKIITTENLEKWVQNHE